MPKKPNCYECVHRGNVPGSGHSSCHHPANKHIIDDPLMQIIGMMTRHFPPVVITGKMKVKGHPHGIAKGWFNWPLNFDPVWLQECEGFKEKEHVPVSEPEG